MERNIRRDGGAGRVCSPRLFLAAILTSAVALGGLPCHAAAQQNPPTTTLLVNVRSDANVGNEVNRGSLTYVDRPVPDATVTLSNLDRPTVAAASAVTNPRGGAIFTVETDSDYRIEVSHPSYNTGRTTVHVGRSPYTAEVRLASIGIRVAPELVSIRIRVVEAAAAAQPSSGAQPTASTNGDQQGDAATATTDATAKAAELQPISGAQVVVTNRERRAEPVTVTTNDNGWATARVEPNPANAFWDVSVTRLGYVQQLSTVRLRDSKIKDYPTLIQMAKDVTGHVVVRARNARRNNAAMGDVLVKVQQLADGWLAGFFASSQTKATQGDGTAVFDLTRIGRYKITASSEGFKSETRYVAFNRYGDEGVYAVDIDLYPSDDAGAEAGTSPGNLAGGLNLTVRVADGNGRALPGASVSVLDTSGGTVDSGVTGEDGVIEFINQRRIPFARSRAGLVVTASKPSYEKAAAEISQLTAESRLSLTETLTLNPDQTVDIARQLGAFFAETTRLQARVAGLTASRRAVLSCNAELNRLESAIAAVEALPSQQAEKEFRAAGMCDIARQLVARTEQRAVEAERRASDMARDLELQAAAIPGCKSLEDARNIQAGYMKAGAAVVEVGVMQEQETGANLGQLPLILDAIKQLQPPTPPEATSNTCYESGLISLRSLDQLVSEGVDPRSEAERLRLLMTAFSASHSAAITQDDKARLQGYLELVSSLNAESLSDYDVRERANLETENAALTASREELRRQQAALSCNVEPATSALQRLDAALEGMQTELWAGHYVLEGGNDCEARLTLRTPPASGSGNPATTNPAPGGTPTSDLPPSLGSIPDPAYGLAPEGAAPAAGGSGASSTAPAGTGGPSAAGPPPSVGGSAPAGSTAGTGSGSGNSSSATAGNTGPGAEPTAAGSSQAAGGAGNSQGGILQGGEPGGNLPPSVGSSTPAQAGGAASSGLSPSTGSTPPAGASSGAEGTLTASLPPSLAGSGVAPGAGAGPAQGNTQGTAQGYTPGSNQGGAPVAAQGSTQGLGTGASTGPDGQMPGQAGGNAGQPQYPGAAGATGGPGAMPGAGGGAATNQAPRTTPGTSRGASIGQGGVEGAPNGCAPAGKSWPKYIFFPALGPNEEHQAVTVTLETGHGAYAGYTWGGNRPDRPHVTVRLEFDGSTARMTYRKESTEIGFVGSCGIGDTGGGRMDVVFSGVYSIVGNPKQYSFTAATMEWH